MIVVEILISHVTPTGNAGNIVEYGSLVMHALIDRSKIRKHVLQLLPGTDANSKIRIVNSDMHVRMAGQQQQRPVLRIDEQVVDEHSYSYAPLGRAQQLLGGQNADVVSTPDEILNVDGS